MRVSQPKCVVLLSCQGVANSESVIGTLRLDKIEKTITHTCVQIFSERVNHQICNEI